MKNYILSVLILLTVVISCTYSTTNSQDSYSKYEAKTIYSTHFYDIIEIDKCEYIIYGYPVGAMAHKGNCKNHN